MGLLGGDCPRVAQGGPPTGASGKGTPGEARQSSSSGTWRLGAGWSVGMSGMAGEAR